MKGYHTIPVPASRKQAILAFLRTLQTPLSQGTADRFVDYSGTPRLTTVGQARIEASEKSHFPCEKSK